MCALVPHTLSVVLISQVHMFSQKEGDSKAKEQSYSVAGMGTLNKILPLTELTFCWWKSWLEAPPPIRENTLTWPSNDELQTMAGFLGHHATSKLHWAVVGNSYTIFFHFVPSYAACLNSHLSNFGKMVHYFVVLGLFFVLPLAVTIFSYRKVLKKIQEHNTGTAQSLRINNNETVTSNEIRLSKSLFVVVFAFMLCWVPAWFITILTRLGFFQ